MDTTRSIALGEAALHTAWEAGRAMTLAQAVEYAVAGLDAGGDLV